MGSTKSNLECFVEDLKDGRVFFFAGSGVSLGSKMPSVTDILGATVDHFLPNVCKDLKERGKLLQEMQPEAFYGVLLGVYDGDMSCLDFWRALHPDSWGGHLRCLPNLVHLMIVRSAYETGLPVFTTNFDTMFEEACEQQSLPYRVYPPDDSPPGDVRNPGKVAICKVHGSVQNPGAVSFSPNSLRTTMRGISSFNTPWVEFLEACMKEAHICFGGYSGRDADYFPQVRLFVSQGAKTPYWFDRFPDDAAKASADAGKSVVDETLRNAKACRARRIDQFPSDVFPGLWGPVFGDAPPCVEPSSGDVKAVLDAIAKRMGSSRAPEELLWLRVLESRGLCERAWTLAQRLLQERDRLRLDLRKTTQLFESATNMARERALFTTYRKLARKTLRLAEKFDRRSPGRAGAVLNARIQVTSSYQMEVPSHLGVRPDILDLGLLAYVMLRFRIGILRAELGSRVKPELHRSHSFVLEEARVREAAIYVGLCQMSGTLGRLLKPRVLKRLHQIERRAYREGNTASRIGALKYLARLDDDPQHGQTAKTVADLSGDVSARSIVERDEALRGRNARGSGDNLKQAIKHAVDNGNPLNEIKARLAKLGKEDSDEKWDEHWSRVCELMDKVESWNLKRTFRRVKSKLQSRRES